MEKARPKKGKRLEGTDTRPATSSKVEIVASEISEQNTNLLKDKKLLKKDRDEERCITKMNEKCLQHIPSIEIPVTETVKVVDRTHENIKDNILTKENITKSKVTIRPYTESQLKAFYCNPELDVLENFTVCYEEAELKGLTVKQHPLYELLTNYFNIREKILGNTLDLDQSRKEYKELQSQLWTVDSISVTGRGQCQDGTSVMSSHSYPRAIFHRSVYQSLLRVLGNINLLTYDNYVLYSYSAEDLRLQIDLYIQTTIRNCMNIANLNKNVAVSMALLEESIQLKPFLAELRLCISVLFAFQRKLIRDKHFVNETREWLGHLIAVLLRMANYQDHLFILHHVLRCPAGVGSWASCFIQVPLTLGLDNPFSNYQINHAIVILAAVLMPISERSKFLEDIAQKKDSTQEALWVMVDSEGEEDEEPSGTSLRENDLVAFINQLPLDDLFRSILGVEKVNFKDTYNSTKIDDHHILKYLSFSTVLLKVFHRGLQTYNQSRYNQFAKRLSRFIRHIVQYATDQWEEFIRVKKNKVDDTAMLERLQVEYDAFFLRAIYYLYSGQKMGAWQFLAVVPYNLITLSTLWRIFYFLHNLDTSAAVLLDPLDDTEYSNKVWDNEIRIQFLEKLGNLTEAESYYLLNTFANMALARTEDEFIKTATLDLLQVGFISEVTQETCSKSSRILLTHITSKSPHLLSDVFKTVMDNMSTIGSLALNLYEELPLSIWKLKDDDIQCFANMLMSHTALDDESKLVRMILSRLNWGFSDDKKLFLSYEIHCDVAILVVTAVDHDPGYSQWGWQTILRLKLHISDNEFEEIGRISDIDRYDILMKGIREKQLLASFVSLLMTSWGHLVPQICSKGLGQLLFLQSHQKHEAVLFALFLIMPIFINSQECIINCIEFQEILTNLLNADRGYISMAKSLISEQNTVLQQFGNMIETQIFNYEQYHLSSPRCLVRLWINSLVSVPNWNKDYGILYLLDVIVRASFFHSDALEVAETIVKELLQCNTPQENSRTIGLLLKWVSASSSNNTFLSSYLSSCTWLSYLMIHIEHEDREKKTGLWNELLLQLNAQKGKVNVDAAIKKAASVCKVVTFSSTSLCIYRWAQQTLDSPVDHPLLPLLWQKFFNLYLARIPVYRSVDKGCVGEKFFEGIVNFAYLKKLKRHLQDTLEFYQTRLNTVATDDDLELRHFYDVCLRLFKAYLLWLEEPRLQEANLLLPSLPPQYEPNLLALIVQGNTASWYQYLDYKRIKKEQKECIKIWRVSNFREQNNVNKPLMNPGNRMESEDPVERMLKRLTSYDRPQAAPRISNKAPIIPVIDISSKENMFSCINHSFKIFTQFSHNHLLKTSEHKGLDNFYQELVTQLYKSVLTKVKKKVPCKGRNQSVHCSGAAIIELEVQEARIQDRILHQIESNRTAYESLLTKSLQAPASSLCTASVTIQQVVKMLHAEIKLNPSSNELGADLFYYIFSCLNEETLSYLPSKTLFSTCLQKLGQSHIYGVESQMPRLLERILRESNLGSYLAPHFSPVNIGTTNMLLMYSTICKGIEQKYDISFALLSKFDIDVWLSSKLPKLSERSQFIDNIVKSLTNLGHEPPLEAMMLHGLFRKHLLSVFEFQFPEHYGEVLIILLRESSRNSEASPLAISVWLDILNSLSDPVQLHIKVPLRDQLRTYAQGQQKLQHQELIETAALLSKHFTQERLQYGLYGLYPKCRYYLDVYALLLGMAGHGIIISTINVHQGLLADNLFEKIWPYLKDIFAPWIVPYSMQNLKENMATWIQQLADDRSVLLPWIASDVQSAQKMINAFFECIMFLIHILPGCGVVLNYIWQWYVTCYAHNSVKEHILNPIHSNLMVLPWHCFWPNMNDLELMLRVVDQYLPECHLFLGHIFISVHWVNWLDNFINVPVSLRARAYQCYLHLLVKLSNEPNIRSKHLEKINTLLVQSENLDWSHLDPAIYQHVMDWYILSCDSIVIFKNDPLDLDFRVLEFLRAVSGYREIVVDNKPDAIEKRLTYLRSYVKLMSVFTSRHKSLLTSKEIELASVINCQLEHLDQVVKLQDELNPLMHEFLNILNICEVGNIALKCFDRWINTKAGNDISVQAMLQSLGVAVTNYEYVALLYEAVLTSYFQSNVSKDFEPNWSEVSKGLKILTRKQTELEQVLLEKGSILTLHAILVQKISCFNNYESILSQCLEWLQNIKLSESTESKLPLIWLAVLNLSVKFCEVDETACSCILYKFSQILLQISEERISSGWGRGLLNAIGINKQTTSLNFRFLCRALAGYILAQLPDMKGEPQIVRHVQNAPSRIGQPGGNIECSKVLLKLDFGQSQGKIKECAELALHQIQDAGNSLHNSSKFLLLLTKQFYTKSYYKDMK